MDCRRRDLYNKLMSTSQTIKEITVLKRSYVENQTPLTKFLDNKATLSPSSRLRDIDIHCLSRGKIKLNIAKSQNEKLMKTYQISFADSIEVREN